MYEEVEGGVGMCMCGSVSGTILSAYFSPVHSRANKKSVVFIILLLNF